MAPLNISHNGEQNTGFITSIVFGFISIVSTVLRIVATERSTRKYGWDDWYSWLALIFYMPYIGYTLWGRFTFLTITRKLNTSICQSQCAEIT